jgi:glycosyltransferase involved in cell wall biosynthesis
MPARAACESFLNRATPECYHNRFVMHLAWFSPIPPVKSGIAGRSAELVAALRRRGHVIDIYVDPPSLSRVAETARASAGQAASTEHVSSAHDFLWRHRRQPYDLTVFQFGNSSHHDYAWAYALQHPGLVVLHDTHLHHARAAFLLRERRVADYRAEFRWNHPGINADVAELAVAGFDSTLYYDYPMVRSLVASARMVAVHGEGARAELIESLPSPARDRIVSIRLGEGETLTPDRERDARRRLRARYGIADDAVVFGCFGGLTPEKRIPQILAALRAILPHAPTARLLLGGAPASHFDVAAAIAAHGLAERVTLTGYLESDAALTDHLAACDVSLNLRWPTARETSGPWLRALAAGRATVITDLVHLADVPSLDPRTWTVQEVGGWRSEVGTKATEERASVGSTQPPTSSLQPPASNLQSPASSLQPPICVAIDILDEDHSLRLAMRRLASDAALRERLGRAARAWWALHHSIDAMVEDYERIMRDAAARSAPDVDLPAHMRNAGDRKLRALIEPFGLGSPL